MVIDWLCGFTLIAQLFCADTTVTLSGYIEGETLFVAPINVARIESLEVRRGDQVKAGATLATLESADARYAVEMARARLAEAEARLSNLRTGKRSEEIAVIAANRAAAQADLEQAVLDLRRTELMVRQKLQSQSQLDQARTQHNVAVARLREIDANLQVAGIAARVQEIEAARRVVDAGRAEVGNAEWILSQRVLKAPADGRIEDVIRYAGETTGPSQPVLALLTPANRKLKLFVPEVFHAEIRVGDVLAIGCDGCAPGLQARVNFIASRPEFTPPVIYSVESRQKLVVLVEAELMGSAVALAPGQIVDVIFNSARGS